MNTCGEFKLGDVVVLKSDTDGQTPMTITEFGTRPRENNEPVAFCNWRDQKSAPHKAEYLCVELRLVSAGG